MWRGIPTDQYEVQGTEVRRQGTQIHVSGHRAGWRGEESYNGSSAGHYSKTIAFF